ncbi:MAG: FlgD immunoglobulin-like domain containing protein, partial [Candidatus Omnitrophota bacterium]|nr:FlgD immunoglobulin-like domain containing protein [Candidatus Omnitrophota bacterium]
TITVTVTNPPLAITKLEDRGPGGLLDAPFTPSLGQTTTISASFNEAVTSWTLSIKNAAGTEVRKFLYSGAGVSSLSQVWNGTTGTGARVAAGTYTYTLSATAPYSGGSATKSGTVTVQ